MANEIQNIDISHTIRDIKYDNTEIRYQYRIIHLHIILVSLVKPGCSTCQKSSIVFTRTNSYVNKIL